MAEEDFAALLQAYLKTDATDDTPEAAAQQAADDRLRDMVLNDPEGCWRFLKAACGADLTDAQLAFVSAGPFEEVLAAHGERLIERLEIAARQDGRMRFLLATVWRGGMSAAVWARIEAIRERLGIKTA